MFVFMQVVYHRRFADPGEGLPARGGADCMMLTVAASTSMQSKAVRENNLRLRQGARGGL